MPTIDDTIVCFSAPHILPGGGFRFTIERTDGQTLTVSCPAAAIAARIVGYAIEFKAEEDPKIPHWNLIHGAIVDHMVKRGMWTIQDPAAEED